jgi:hypothetical protein
MLRDLDEFVGTPRVSGGICPTSGNDFEYSQVRSPSAMIAAIDADFANRNSSLGRRARPMVAALHGFP